MEPIFDATWRRRALAGEPAAVRALTDAALGPLYAFCLYRVGRDRHLCEEVVQETLVRAIQTLDAYDPARSGGQAFTWLTGLARNEIRRVLGRGPRRARQPRQTSSLDVLWERIDRELLEVYARLDSDPFDEDLLRRDETRQIVNATMSQLPPNYRRRWRPSTSTAKASATSPPRPRRRRRRSSRNSPAPRGLPRDVRRTDPSLECGARSVREESVHRGDAEDAEKTRRQERREGVTGGPATGLVISVYKKPPSRATRHPEGSYATRGISGRGSAFASRDPSSLSLLGMTIETFRRFLMPCLSA